MTDRRAYKGPREAQARHTQLRQSRSAFLLQTFRSARDAGDVQAAMRALVQVRQDAMTRELAVLHARENIRVNALCPGPLRTELLMKFLDTEDKRQRRLVHIPMGRFGEAGEMARAALFLASEEASYLTGATFSVDGGITAAYVTPE